MKLLSFIQNERRGWGALSADQRGVIDLGRRVPELSSLRACLQAGSAGMDRARAACAHANTSGDFALGDVTLDVPIPNPPRIFCIGVNYAHRNAEYRDGSTLPQYPSIFMRSPDSFSAHGQSLLEPKESHQLDYEGEIGIVIGQGGRRIRRTDAGRHIAGLTCINEGTIRDWLHHAKFNVTQGKNWHRSGSVGPWITTADEFPGGYGLLRVTTHVNGEMRQDDTTDNLMFDFGYLVEYLSTFTTLQAGDVIATGTPIGAGVRFDPPRYLRPGDTVEVTVTGVGTLSNRVEAE